MASICYPGNVSFLWHLHNNCDSVRPMNAFDFLVHNFDYDAAMEEYDTVLIKFGSQAIQEDLC